MEEATSRKRTLLVGGGIVLALFLFFAGLAIGNNGSGNGLTGLAVANVPQEAIPIEVTAVVDQLSLPINSDLELVTSEVVITTKDSTITLNNENVVTLKEFRGDMTWENSTLTIEGKASQYFGQNTNIDWEDVRRVQLTVIQGVVDVETLDLKSLEMHPEGTLKVHDDTLQVDGDQVVLSNVKGGFTVELNRQNVQMTLIGSASKVDSIGSEYRVVVK